VPIKKKSKGGQLIGQTLPPSTPMVAEVTAENQKSLQVSGRNEGDTEVVDGENSKQKKRQGLDGILDHYRSHGAAQTFLSQTCRHVLADNRLAVKVYVMPKYSLRFAMSKKVDMKAMLALALSSTVEDVERACAHPETRTYHLYRHMYLRRTFVSVYVLDGGEVVDMHKHWNEAGGQSEHTHFVKGLQPASSFSLSSGALGPKSSRPQPKKHPVAPKRSAALKSKLGPPLDGTPLELPVSDFNLRHGDDQGVGLEADHEGLPFILHLKAFFVHLNLFFPP